MNLLSRIWFEIGGQRVRFMDELARLEARMATDRKMRDHLRDRLQTAIKDHKQRSHIALRLQYYTRGVLKAECRAADIRSFVQASKAQRSAG